MQALRFSAEIGFGAIDSGANGGGTRTDRHVIKHLGEGVPSRVGRLAGGEFVDGPARDRPEAVGIEVIERHADDSARGNEAGIHQMKQAGQEFASR